MARLALPVLLASLAAFDAVAKAKKAVAELLQITRRLTPLGSPHLLTRSLRSRFQ